MLYIPLKRIVYRPPPSRGFFLHAILLRQVSENYVADFMEGHTVVLDGFNRVDVDLTDRGKRTRPAFGMDINRDVVLFAQFQDMIEKFVHVGTISEELPASIALAFLFAFFLFHCFGRYVNSNSNTESFGQGDVNQN